MVPNDTPTGAENSKSLAEIVSGLVEEVQHLRETLDFYELNSTVGNVAEETSSSPTTAPDLPSHEGDTNASSGSGGPLEHDE